MKRLMISFLTLLLCSNAILAQESKFDINEFYPIEASHSYVGFQVKYMGYAMVRGRFANFNGTVRYDENDLSKTSVSISIEVPSIDTDLEWRDKDLKSPNWFDAEQFPEIFFQSNESKPSSDGMMVKGNLTIKDVTKEVTLQMTRPSGVIKDIRGDKQVIFNGTLTIDRTDYHVAGENWSKVKEGITGVEKEIHIEFTILAKQIQENNYRNWVRNPKTPQGKIFSSIENGSISEGLNLFDELVKNDTIQVNPGALNSVGYMLLKLGRVDDALKVFEKNIDFFPDNANVYDSYAEAWAHKDLNKAKSYYETALKMNPNNNNAIEILRHLK